VKGKNIKMKISFMGLGQMGKGMALNIAKGDCEFLAYDVIDKAFPEFEERGIRTSTNIGDIYDSDVIFLCLPNTKVVEDVILGENGLIDNLKANQIIVDCSTIGVLETQNIAKKLDEKGIDFLDAPVSGRQSKADDGTLTIMIGGKEELYNKLKPYFDYMGNNVLYMGKSGNGQLTKAINNSIYDINCAALAEMLPFAVKLGLEPEQIGKVINTGTAKSGASEFFIPQMLEGKFEYGFTMNQAYKDLVSCNEIAVHEGIPLPVLGATTNVYKMVLLSGYGDLYKGAMICFFENLLDVKFRKEQYKDL
jgi:3-hydroxyisobutyrate dehydrogenase-like beta-hydroxyacid dehydrogenase